MQTMIKNSKKLQVGVITEKIQESKAFFSRWLGWTVKFESEWFLLLAHPECKDQEIAFMLPNQEAVRKSYFQKPYSGQGIWLIVESENASLLYENYKKQSAPIDLHLTTEEWGDTHFTMVDPNGIGIDFVQLRE